MATCELILPVRDYNLAATLDSGQAFRWQRHGPAWSGVIGRRWVRLEAVPAGIRAETTAPVADWQWLTDYLQCHVNLAAIQQTFPADPPMQTALAACPGLRLLRQDPWECLASFMLSSTKQIVQIRKIIGYLCERHGTLVATPVGAPPAHAFPTSAQIAALNEARLRDCKMGFRAPNVLAAARRIAAGEFDLERVGTLPHAAARAELMQLRGVGGKIADCVLLFAFGFNAAFPVDVWIKKALQELYFPRRRAPEKRLQHFAATHFGEHGGYAQQYLFHYMRTRRHPRQEK
jgi:N-glycosylase/DNA lyase